LFKKDSKKKKSKEPFSFNNVSLKSQVVLEYSITSKTKHIYKFPILY